MAEHGGSSHKARLNDIAELGSSENVASASTYRKGKGAFINSELPSTDWLTNLLYIGRSFDVTEGDYLNNLTIYPEFKMVLNYVNQLELLRSIPADNRIAHVDSTGELVDITQKEATI